MNQASELLSTTDAHKWASEFKRTFGDNVVDEETMLGWFANAIETGRSAGQQTQQPEEDMPPNPPGIGGVNATYFIKRLDDARLAKRGVYEAKTLVFSWREAEVLKAILQRTEQANGPVFDSDDKINEIRAILANFGTAPAGNPNEYVAWIGLEELLTRIREVLP